ncbi:MAG: M48 family metalloprotease, partial [Terriglobales bacterium]
GAAGTAPAGGAAGAPAVAPLQQRILRRMAANEQALVERMGGLSPRIETYLQDFAPNSLGGESPVRDRYYLGRLRWDGKRFRAVSFLRRPQPAWLEDLGPLTGALAAPLAHLFQYNYGGRNAFVRMLFPDVAHFNRRYYRFQFLRRVFLGQVRCYVFAVAPRNPRIAGFWGRVWIEDEHDHLVRFNGTFYRPRAFHPELHFDSWRMNVAPGLWVPFFVYSEETDFSYGFIVHTRFRAQTRLWGYQLRYAGGREALASMSVEGPQVHAPAALPHDLSPVASYRAWQRQAEDNILRRLERAGLVAPAGPVDRVLDTVLNNLVITNHLQIDPPPRCRVLLTTPLEAMTIGHTIVLSRGLIDTLPNEASLAAILAHELAHIALDHTINSEYGFADTMLFPTRDIFAAIQLRRPAWQEQQADARAIQLLEHSPYKNELGEAGLYLRALRQRAGESALIGPQFSNGFFQHGLLDRLTALIPKSPPLRPASVRQVAAFPLGSWVYLNPWTDQLRLETAANTPLISAREKMPFQITPLFPYLVRVSPASAAHPAPAATTGRR